MNRRFILLAGVLSVGSAFGDRAVAQDGSAYPARAIRIVVGFGAGGASDILARLVGMGMEKSWGQPVVVENRAGAQGNIAMAHVAKAAPDGYTIAMVPVGNAAVNPSLFKDLPYNTVTDFAPVTQIAVVENVLVVSAKSPAKTLKELIELGRGGANLTYASPGAGSQAHLAGELLARAAGIPITHVPYRGLSTALTDTLTGEVTMTFTQLSLAKPFIDTGEMRALGVASRERSPALPNIPTIAEAGDMPGFEALSWYALMAPAGTPDPIVRKIQAEVARIVQTPETRKALEAQGATPVGNSPEDLARIIEIDTARWAKVIRDSNITVR
jgi:tripartite-type tricarboxylate transporter receptor subunit TctC